MGRSRRLPWAGGVLALVLSTAGTVGALPPRAPVSVQLRHDVAPRPLPAGAVNLSLGANDATSLFAEKPAANGAQTVQVPVGVQGPASNLRVTSGNGAIKAGLLGKSFLEARVGERVIVSSDTAKTTAANTEIHENQPVAMPWLVVETVKTDTGAELHTARPFLTLSNAIHWDGAAHRHIAEFEFWLEAETGDDKAFSQPIDALFLVTCDSVSPPKAQIASVGVAAHTTITVSCSPAVKNATPTQAISVVVDSGKLAYPFTIPRRPGPPALSVDQSHAYGLGFGDLALTVSSVEEDGSPLAADADLPVNFVVSQGHFAVPNVVLKRAQQSASVATHPGGLGTMQVTAKLRQQDSPPLSVSLGVPLLPFIAMLAGGAIGGVLVSLGLDKGKKSRQRAVVEGVLVGVVMATLSLLIPTAVFGLPDIAPFVRSEAGLFAVATLSGLLGTPLLKSLASKVFGFAPGATAS